MQSTKSLKVMLLLFALALSTAVFAGEKGNFQVSEAVQVNGTTLPAGDYVAKWDGSGPSVQVNITHNGRTVATVPAKLVQLDQKASQDAAEVQNLAGGRRELTGLHFSGKKYSLQLGAATMDASSVK